MKNEVTIELDFLREIKETVHMAQNEIKRLCAEYKKATEYYEVWAYELCDHRIETYIIVGYDNAKKKFDELASRDYDDITLSKAKQYPNGEIHGYGKPLIMR